MNGVVIVESAGERIRKKIGAEESNMILRTEFLDRSSMTTTILRMIK